jgi:arginyl-tRNA--protein-N-Asp/Glu arginylyltransferase
MANVKPRNLCRRLFKRLQTLPLPCKHLFSLMNFRVNNQEYFHTNSVYTVLTQEIDMISIYQLPNFHDFREVHASMA